MERIWPRAAGTTRDLKAGGVGRGGLNCRRAEDTLGDAWAPAGREEAAAGLTAHVGGGVGMGFPWTYVVRPGCQAGSKRVPLKLHVPRNLTVRLIWK